MHALIFAALFSAQPIDETVVAVNVATITMKDAERLNGKLVVATFLVGTESYTWGAGTNLITVTGPRSSACDRTVHLKGDRLDGTDQGKRVTVLGTLRVVRVPAAATDKNFTETTDVRIVER
jgi:hypothetical protein